MGTAGELSAAEWLDNNEAAILAFSIRAGAVAYQGARIDDAMNQLRAGDPRDIALAQLHSELRDEYAAMLAARHAAPYDELQQHAETAHAELTERAREASTLHLIVATEVRDVEDGVEQAVEHVPAAEQQLLAYMREQIARLVGSRGVEQAWGEYDAASLVERYAGALAMMEYVPFPEHLTPEERAEIEDQIRARAQTAETPAALPMDIHALAAAVRRANPEASQGLGAIAALILLQSPNQRFTAADIGSVLYPDDDPARAANKVGALLFHSLEGRRGATARMLAESGYRLVREVENVSEQTEGEQPRYVTVYGILPIAQ